MDCRKPAAVARRNADDAVGGAGRSLSLDFALATHQVFNNADIDLGTLPEFKGSQLYPIDSRYPWITLGLALTFWLPVGIAVITAALLIDDTPKLVRAAMFIVSAAFVLWMGWYSHKAAAVIRFAVREHDVTFRRGVFWVRETIQPINRVQHVERIQGPIEKRFGLARLRLFSAGTGSVTFEIPGLGEDRALQLQQLILERKRTGSTASPAHSND